MTPSGHPCTYFNREFLNQEAEKFDLNMYGDEVVFEFH